MHKTIHEIVKHQTNSVLIRKKKIDKVILIYCERTTFKIISFDLNKNF